MSWNRTTVKTSVALVLAALVFGCGGGEDQEAKRWVNELLLVNGDFQETAVEAKSKIAKAQTGGELAAAYRGYAEDLHGQTERVEDLDPPASCEDVQADIEAFMSETASVTEELSDQVNLTQGRLREIEGEVAVARAGLVRSMHSVAEEEGC
jgi:hypothetical protein